VAAQFLLSRCGINLEPPNAKGGLCDLVIRKEDEVYVECKALNIHDSVLNQKRQKFA
jgi:hypothetical protein